MALFEHSQVVPLVALDEPYVNTSTASWLLGRVPLTMYALAVLSIPVFARSVFTLFRQSDRRWYHWVVIFANVIAIAVILLIFILFRSLEGSFGY